MTVALILAGALVLWSVFYIWTEYHWKPEQFFWPKALNSLLFVGIGVVGMISGNAPGSYAYFIFAALILGMIGDLLLVFTASAKFFKAGLLAFLIGQIVYGVNFLNFGGFMIYDVFIYIAVVSVCIFIYNKSSLELGEMTIPVLFYLLIITFMFTMAVSLIYKGVFTAKTTAVIASGAVLFLASDCVLAFNKFGKTPHKALRGINLSLYYAGQMLLALSILTF